MTFLESIKLFLRQGDVCWVRLLGQLVSNKNNVMIGSDKLRAYLFDKKKVASIFCNSYESILSLLTIEGYDYKMSFCIKSINRNPRTYRQVHCPFTGQLHIA